MSVPRIVSAGEWLAERKELLAAEEQAAERRRRLVTDGRSAVPRMPGPGRTAAWSAQRRAGPIRP
jgi:predicted dithiol-disulfide oxidoreductase (DUF899 family)